MPRLTFAPALVLAAAALSATILTADDFPYHQPSSVVMDVLNAPPTPSVSVSPQRDYAVFSQGVRYPPISEVAQPMLRLAGIRIDTNTTGLHMVPYAVSYLVKRLSDGADVKLTIPVEAKLGAPVWSPDGKHFAFTNTTGPWNRTLAGNGSHGPDVAV